MKGITEMSKPPLLELASDDDEGMSHYDLYVGRADDPRFTWEDGDCNGNIPEVVLHLACLGLGGCMDAMKRLESSKYGGKRLDWGACGAYLTKERIADFLHEFAPDAGWLLKSLPMLKSLDESRLYVLFACES